MPSNYKVSQGEHVPGVAKKFKFSDFHAIWDFGPNANLTQSLHRGPNLLFPGDILGIPDRDSKTFDGATDLQHLFQVSVPSLQLKVALDDVNFNPFKAETYRLTLTSGSTNNVTDSAGKTDDEIDAGDQEANLEVAARNVQLRLKIGSLNPLVENPSNDDQIAGWQVRLYNLGYFSGFTSSDTKQLNWAVEEFQRDHGWVPEKGKKPTGLMDSETRDKLELVYGC